MNPNRIARYFGSPAEDAPLDPRYVERLKATIRNLNEQLDDALDTNRTLCTKLAGQEQLRQRADALGAECARLERQQERAERYHEKVVVSMGSVIFMLATLVFAMGCAVYRMGHGF